ncbi:MAG: TIGR02450 family Trp-rich protein [Granulosicoccaceae bacterium]
MNRVHPKKLLNSKWTSKKPVAKELHFLVSSVTFDEQSNVLECLMEAVMSKREFSIQWQDLKDSSQWEQGWR